MKHSRNVKQFALGVFTVAKNSSAIREVSTSLEEINALLKKEPALRAFVMTRRVSDRHKTIALRSMLENSLHPVVMELLLVLMEKKLVGILASVTRVYKHLMARESDVENLVIYSADDLGVDDVNAIVNILEQKSGKSLQWTTIKDPTLIGGLKIRIGNVFLDGSISSQLHHLKENLLTQ